MDLEYLSRFLDKTEFPREAAAFLMQAAQAINDKAERQLAELTACYLSAARREVEERLGYGYAVRENSAALEEIAGKTGFSPDTLWLLALVEASIPVRDDWLGKGRTESLFFDTFADLRYKALECREVHGVWGNFVAGWYAIFYTDRIVKLGRLEFETASYGREEPFAGGGLRLEKGSPVLSIHIPSSGEPFHRAAREASYRLAWEHFPQLRQNGKLPCICHSWLLYPDYKPLLPEGSNIRDFMADFEIIGRDETEQFGDDWRLYGADSGKPVEQWPEKTRMQRAFKQYFLEGGKPGYGYGVRLVDANG